ncbi:hypothetical protein FRB99_004386 [Tulasnella sp. 403]|nr:hypothetical protein FRB99_004386 [Tulasnella sp. 403]
MSDIIAAGLDNGGLQIFNAGTGESLAILGDEATIHSLSFSSDGRWLMEEGGAGLRKWDISRLTKSNPEAIFHDEEIRGILVPLDESGTVAVIDESHDMHIYTNCFGGPIIRHKIGSLPRNIIRPRCYHKGLGQGDDDVKRLRMGIRISAHTANGVGLMVHSQVAHRTMFRVYNFGSYDYPGTYRFDSRPDESFAYSDNQG